jgi:hypothetical protein
MSDEEKKGTVVEPEAPANEEVGPPAVEERLEEAVEERSPAEQEPEVDESLPQENQGRLIVSGIVAAVIVSAIAIAVAGVFQLTSKWFFACPKDMTVNGPAPALWEDTLSQQLTPRTLGVPEKLLEVTKFKVPVVTSQESGQGTREKP